MRGEYVFGYGSLVNLATHGYADIRPARLRGWRREWRHAAGRQVAFLTVVPSDGDQIDGVTACVPLKDWAELDAREASYIKQTTEAATPMPDGKLCLYHAPRDLHPPAAKPLPILLSYLDVVVQGYLQAFGEQGVEAFFQTTDGWDAHILNDRDAPRYKPVSYTHLTLPTIYPV